ncbi:protein involved in spore germination [Arthrobacter sp. Hiyo4]|nr:protein involved in spore germination [Arthrobacter sp. Hiyo4]
MDVLIRALRIRQDLPESGAKASGQYWIRKAALGSWLLHGLEDAKGTHQGPGGRADEKNKQHWWRVMCLTGVDYFSTLGYQPASAALAAGAISPLATLVLVAVTLFGALPVYRRVAGESHRGEGSIAMLERLLPKWRGKLLVLVLLGFAATDFMITMTLSAADATAHLIENPFAPDALHGQEVAVTLVLLAVLAAVFLRGFKEAIGVAVVLVILYLGLNVMVIAWSLAEAAAHPVAVGEWWQTLNTSHGNPLMAVAIALLVFPSASGPSASASSRCCLSTQRSPISLNVPKASGLPASSSWGSSASRCSRGCWGPLNLG